MTNATARRRKEEPYNYDLFRWNRFKQELHFHGGPEPGELARDFELPTIHGGLFRLLDRRGPRPALLEFVSITCPMAQGARPGLVRLYNALGRAVRFLSIYVREAAPTADYPHHTSEEQKMRQAREWAERDAIPWTVAVDHLDGRVHKTYGCFQNGVYLIASCGRVAFRALWAGDEGLLCHKMRELLREESSGDHLVNLGQHENLLVPMIHGAAEFVRGKMKRTA